MGQLRCAFIWTSNGTRYWIVTQEGGLVGGVFFLSEPVFSNFQGDA